MTVENSSRPVQTDWTGTFKRLWRTRNARYALLWLTGGILFALLIKPAVRRRDKELMIEDVEQYLEKQRKKDSS